MGTETRLPSKDISLIDLYLVKLNNPLMGTETYAGRNDEYAQYWRKLN